MIDITVDIREAIAFLQNLPGATYRAGTKTLRTATETITRIMQRPGLPVQYPIQWDSEKQRKFVIAKLRRENNLPYQRTGATEQAWGYMAISNGYQIENIGHKAVFIYGAPSGVLPGATKVTSSGQSHIHAGRWRLVRQVLDAVLARLPQEVLEALRVEVSR